MQSEAARNADFSGIRYAQVWEDADILLEGLDIQPGQTCLSIASAGDNALAMLGKNPERVIALDLSHAQLACLELRAAAYRRLAHPELLELIGSRPSRQRFELYQRCRSGLSEAAQAFWAGRRAEIESGIGCAGKFERYFAIFREWILPLVHSRRRIHELLEPRSLTDRYAFYEKHWNHWRWRWLFRVFFSRAVMGKMGRDPSFFRYVEGSVADRILQRTAYALTELDPSTNPYLHWILTGTHNVSLPYALRPENFETIRANLDRLEWRQQSLESFLSESPNAIDRFNLSDIFEYMSEDNYEALLQTICKASKPHARLAYWNMLAPRSRPDSMADMLRPMEPLAKSLFAQDKAFFYSRFVLEEVI